MTIIVKSSDENTISIPADLMTVLNLRDGDEVKAVVEGETLRLARLDRFVALRGALSDDESFDRDMELIDRAWHSWTNPTSPILTLNDRHFSRVPGLKVITPEVLLSGGGQQ